MMKGKFLQTREFKWWTLKKESISNNYIKIIYDMHEEAETRVKLSAESRETTVFSWKWIVIRVHSELLFICFGYGHC